MSKQVYTDGSCFLTRSNKPGGWAFVIPEELEVSGGTQNTTNNRMELTAAIECIEYLHGDVSKLEIHSDSAYVVNGITKYISNWKRKGWKDVKNPDLWQKLDKLVEGKDISWQWVKAHSTNEWNNRADLLAKEEASRYT